MKKDEIDWSKYKMEALEHATKMCDAEWDIIHELKKHNVPSPVDFLRKLADRIASSYDHVLERSEKPKPIVFEGTGPEKPKAVVLPPPPRLPTIRRPALEQVASDEGAFDQKVADILEKAGDTLAQLSAPKVEQEPAPETLPNPASVEEPEEEAPDSIEELVTAVETPTAIKRRGGRPKGSKTKPKEPTAPTSSPATVPEEDWEPRVKAFLTRRAASLPMLIAELHLIDVEAQRRLYRLLEAMRKVGSIQNCPFDSSRWQLVTPAT